MAKHLRAWTAAAATTAAAAALVAVPGTAQAGNSTVKGCPSGYVCAYDGTGLSGSIVRKTEGSWTATGYKVKSLFNNGRAQTGADHIRYKGIISYGDGWYATVKGCLHYSTGSAADAGSYASFPYKARISTATWGGECGSGEETREIGQRFRA
ncbi:peptidase inhibitor family I36 protein [Streptomyces mesophilus]|uniref:peptidase inhibitor family I36 protein n=1 Tax=Streptomyces mesophilus TaxID=1775132 RepID=UPI00331C245A